MLTQAELRVWRGLTGLQLQYAESEDSHKVMEFHLRLISTIEKICTRLLTVQTGEGWTAKMPEQARAEFTRMCADAMAKSRDGFGAWAKAQTEIEQWVAGYVQSALVQATAKVSIINSTN